MKVLVCGGRNVEGSEFYEALHDVLAELHEDYGITHIIHGNAKGADTMAGLWAVNNFVQEVRCPANWDGLGKSAGYVRNRAMISLGPDVVVALPGGLGTANMVRIAESSGVKVIQCKS